MKDVNVIIQPVVVVENQRFNLEPLTVNLNRPVLYVKMMLRKIYTNIAMQFGLLGKFKIEAPVIGVYDDKTPFRPVFPTEKKFAVLHDMFIYFLNGHDLNDEKVNIEENTLKLDDEIKKFHDDDRKDVKESE